ncbi:hypothetical protein NCCP2222_33180 [Sporosarcina sp. NCCP-2222]|uniref:DUF5050 domain-containing protein n=1 Tax=Sporosarcina sp. NCCP-2222 TaxID=2935073 RepID=UPI00208BFF57|nr:DUF5050 domain-containing protein [Sporosarcina sp. NCCP-2222]GKV57371.1 hypothetical protein NCCP2222_33180 [Sporosarcina sp. NCCP-2222]
MKGRIAGMIAIALLIGGCGKETSENEIATKQSVEKVEAAVTESGDMMNEADLYTEGTVLPARLVWESESHLFNTNQDMLFSDSKEEDGKNYLLDEVTDGESKITSLTVDGEWVYYMKGDVLWKVKRNGQEKQELRIEDGKEHLIMTYLAYQDHLYFISKERFADNASADVLMRMDGNGGKLTTLFDDAAESIINDIYVRDGKLYFTTTQLKGSSYVTFLHTIDEETGELATVMEVSELTSYQIIGDWVYYIENERLFKRKLNSTKKVQLLEDPVVNFIVYDNRMILQQPQGVYIMAGSKTLDGMPITAVEAKAAFMSPHSTGVNYLQLNGDRFDLYGIDYEDTVEPETDVAWDESAYDDFHAQLYGIYEELLARRDPFTIAEMEEEESTRLTGGDNYFVNGHILGATKTLLFGVTNLDEESLRSISVDENAMRKLASYAASFIKPDQPNGGYGSYRVNAVDENMIHVEQGDVEADITFKRIGDTYYFEKMTGTKLMVVPPK